LTVNFSQRIAMDFSQLDSYTKQREGSWIKLPTSTLPLN
jgi:hypothetical protein